MSRSVLVPCLLVAVCSAALASKLRGGNRQVNDRIIGGEPVDISLFPWQVSLQLFEHICGGSIIGPTRVLTAAHCVDSPVLLAVRAGTSIRESGGSLHGVLAVIQHEDYDRNTNDYDIALLAISNPFSFGSNIQAVNVGDSEPPGGTAVNITGWGHTEHTREPERLQAVTAYIVDRDACSAAYAERGLSITQSMICAGVEQGGKDSCQRDSGGPLVAGSTQYGVVSWGQGCAQAEYPGVYANVPHVRAWITDKTGI